MESPRILIVEDVSAVYEHIKDAINAVEKDMNLEIKCDHFETLQELKDANENLGTDYDLIILDLRLDTNNEGNPQETLGHLFKISKTQFVPVVIYTGYADVIEEKYTSEWKFIKVIQKGSDGERNLEKAIKKLIRMKYNSRCLMSKIAGEFRVLSIDLLDKIFEDEDQIGDRAFYALVLSRLSALLTTRLNLILSEDSIPVEAKIVYPPLDKDENNPISMGDVLKDKDGKNWFVASPTCDLISSQERKPKIRDVLLQRCFTSLDDRDTYLHGIEKNSNKRGNDNYYTFRVPSDVSESKLLLIDCKLYKTEPYEEVVKWKKQLSIAPTYAEDAKETLIRDLMRLGVPDTIPKHEDLVKQFFKNSQGS
jgi:CheY-like chemotaxis protein